ncbi:uncharacterized protein LOC106056220 isoform X2 [Biomphalaria glabrata]|uniref:Uncharacterized protein LOC106056220 isoform X2 n=1 Tax=Biomphalaria glabrata TaxID=6526 RepID=A0A2C9LS56_BIOGL|nr:uncharacterized protein LOC106056220 isoform X2 [Biomphalaria glabrata]
MAVQEGYLGLFFTPSVNLAISLVSISVALLGVFSNILIIIIFYHVYGVKRFQSILWINLSGCQIAQCFAMVFDTLGNHVTFFGDGQWMCGARHLFPICMDQVFLGSYLVLLTERMAIVHLSMFHSLIPKLYTILLLYGWSFGLSFLFLLHNDILKYKPPLQCLTPFLNQLPQESATISLFSMTTLAILISLVSVMLSVPQTASKVEKLRQEIEGKGVTVTLFIGSLVLLLSAPRHILSLLYWMDSMDILTFQENYISTVQKMVINERQKIADKRKSTIHGLPKAMSSSSLPEVRPKGMSLIDLKPRKEISLLTDEDVSKLSTTSSIV